MVATIIKTSGNALFGHKNYVLSGAIGASAQISVLGVQNLQNDQGSPASAWQTPSGVLSAWLIIDAGTISPWRVFGLFRTNLTQAATVRWRLANNADMSSPILDTGVISAGIMPGYLQHVFAPAPADLFLPEPAPILTGEDEFAIISEDEVFIEIGPGPSPLLAVDAEDDPVVDEFLISEDGNLIIGEGTGIASGGALSARYCRLDISDPTNPDLHLNIPLVYAGDAWEPGRQISSESGWGVDAITDEVTARNGQEYPVFRYEKRRWDISLAALPDDEVFAGLAEVMRYARRGGNVLFVPFPRGTESAYEAVMGRMALRSDVTYPFQTKTYRAFRASVTERL